jgi:hypothetical protein
MYQITADNTVLFSSRNRELSKAMYYQYKRLYSWSDVRAKKVSR